MLIHQVTKVSRTTWCHGEFTTILPLFGPCPTVAGHGVAVEAALDGVDQHVGQAVGDRLYVSEEGLAGASAQKQDNDDGAVWKTFITIQIKSF